MRRSLGVRQHRDLGGRVHPRWPKAKAGAIADRLCRFVQAAPGIDPLRHRSRARHSGFVAQHWKRIDTLMVHCEQGRSRSAAVAAAIEHPKFGTRASSSKSRKFPIILSTARSLRWPAAAAIIRTRSEPYDQRHGLSGRAGLLMRPRWTDWRSSPSLAGLFYLPDRTRATRKPRWRPSKIGVNPNRLADRQ
jgi:hypothetical protein